jgi:hypothetical protein
LALKLIKFEPGLIQVDKNDEHLKNGVDGDADVLDFRGRARGWAWGNERGQMKSETICSHKN